MNISLPKSLLSELERYVTQGNKSRFIARAVERELVFLKRKQALQEFAALPPTFTAIADSTAYVRQLRAESEQRLNRSGL